MSPTKEKKKRFTLKNKDYRWFQEETWTFLLFFLSIVPNVLYSKKKKSVLLRTLVLWGTKNGYETHLLEPLFVRVLKKRVKARVIKINKLNSVTCHSINVNQNKIRY